MVTHSSNPRFKPYYVLLTGYGNQAENLRLTCLGYFDEVDQIAKRKGGKERGEVDRVYMATYWSRFELGHSCCTCVVSSCHWPWDTVNTSPLEICCLPALGGLGSAALAGRWMSHKMLIKFLRFLDILGVLSCFFSAH
ncbi:hypothetical protein Pcinc_025803 [Petrolisthes cinctipes]|uniref:Uncharacterized protein n=1 Tax=Petrolisthes cinctipes TaxID=88211 RepID=A0AAE1KD58_PETCI|nr:hypothetical protein Pcinc_025803 [Petrolisthes cinctipes]